MLRGDQMIISVAGNICSGKTTLAKKISALYNFTYIPGKRNELSFLDAFFRDIPKLFLATQTSFLISKVLEIDENRNKNLVIDRSLFEDVHVFAQHWMDNYSIDEKEKRLYNDLANYMISTIPPTDVYIICNCERKALLKRFEQRKKRQFENKYPEDYLEKLCDKYDSIVFPPNAVVVEVDTEKLDVRDDRNVLDIMSSILYHRNTDGFQQFTLFDYITDSRIERGALNPHIRMVSNPYNLFFPDDLFQEKKKQIYLAAPFTEFATSKQNQDNDDQLNMNVNEKRAYHILPEEYQRFLKRIRKLVSCNGEFDVLLPHQEENNWGKTYIPNTKVIEAMLENMKNADLLVAIISNSIGVHMEMAMMSIQSKPMVLIILDELTTGFFSDGFKVQKDVMVLHVRSMGDVYNAINCNNVLEFIRSKLKYENMD